MSVRQPVRGADAAVARAAAPGPWRVFATVLLAGLLALAMLLGLSGPVSAVEEEIPDPEAEEQPPPDIEELCAEGTIAEEFCPDTYEEPSWFQWLIYPLLIIGLVMVTLMLVAYLTWHPRFAREAEERKRSRR